MNTIPLRITDHIKNIPPFSFLGFDDQYQIASKVVVQYFENGELIFSENDSLSEYFFLVQEGAVGLFSNGTILVEECDEGDIFGLRALVRNDGYKLTARAIEETILYAIPSHFYESLLKENKNASNFILKSFANKITTNENISGNLPSDQILEDSITANFSKNPVTCSKEASVQEAAQIMSEKKVGSLVITENDKPLGILTDKDLRIKVATGKYSISEQVNQIMSSPVICSSPNLSIAEAQIQMMKHKITHLCITEDGTINTKIIGVLSEHDIILIRENNPSVIIKQIKRCTSVTDLKQIKRKTEQLLHQYIQQSAAITFVSKIISEINASLTIRVIDLAIEELGEQPPVSFSWINLGSQGRSEQLLTTDQDNAIIYEDTTNDNAKIFFLKLGELVTETLHKIGFEYCPAQMMASNERWCLSISEWKNQFSNWISKPTEENLMFCTIFFDFSSVYGSHHLAVELNAFISSSIQKHPVFLNLLGKNALQNPAPLGFFRQFLVEQSGEHKNQFDIKSRAMMPLADAARLLSLELGQSERNTIERFQALLKIENQNSEIYRNCIEAFLTLLEFRTRYGMKHEDSGRFIALDELTKLEKLALKGCFKAIKEIQNLIMIRYQLAQIL